MREKQNRGILNSKIICYIATAILFLYAFRNVNEGIDVTDTGYHFSNFMYMNEMDPMWIFSTYLASLLGHFFTTLPGGNTLLGINIYSTFVPAFLGVLSFLFFVKVLKKGLLESFWGIFIALCLCWCPTTCLYNYLTYLFFTLGALALYIGLIKEKRRYLVCAGIFLGLNVFVRFPNVAEVALIMVVWYICFLKKENIKTYVQKTAWCLLGYVLGLGAVVIQIQCKYGIEAYINGILRLFGMTENASDYTPYGMILNIIDAYLYSAKWFAIIIICVGLGFLGYMVLPGKLIKLKTIGYFVCCLVLMRWFYGQGMFSLIFREVGYGAIFNWGVVFLMTALVIGVYIVLNPKAEIAEKIYASIIIIIIAITPIGSNTQLYSNLSNMFLVLPFVFCFLTSKLKKIELLVFSTKKYAIQLSIWPLRIMCFVCTCVLSFQAATFGNTFIFGDDFPRDSKVTEISALKHMKTNTENARQLEELGRYVTDAKLEGKQVLLCGHVPALSAYLRMPFVMSPWPDLASYTQETFELELQKVINHLEENRPVIIMSRKFYKSLTNLEENVENTDAYKKNEGFKLARLRDMIEENNYNLTFKNKGYVIYE